MHGRGLAEHAQALGEEALLQDEQVVMQPPHKVVENLTTSTLSGVMEAQEAS